MRKLLGAVQEIQRARRPVRVERALVKRQKNGAFKKFEDAREAGATLVTIGVYGGRCRFRAIKNVFSSSGIRQSCR